MLTLAARTIDRTISGRGRSWVPVQVEGPQHLINSYLTTLIQRRQSEEGRPGLAPPVKAGGRFLLVLSSPLSTVVDADIATNLLLGPMAALLKVIAM